MHFLINFAIFVLYLVFSNHISRIQMRYFIHFAYKGTPFHGWQKQNNAITVQEVLDEKLSIILTEKIDKTTLYVSLLNRKQELERIRTRIKDDNIHILDLIGYNGTIDQKELARIS